ncbi:MAG: 2-phospho-L-lactate transferase [Methanoregulaceae archaeon]|nr:2-phospho-L-lactate transferase [Methanoregulaceae archaeon]
MITLLSGGTGTPKLLRGVRHHTDDQKINVVVNTAEDVWISGGHLSPDIDTVMYLFAGVLNTETWWGIAGYTFLTHKALLDLGADEYIAIGDRDRAVQIARGDLMNKGKTLTEATVILCRNMGIKAGVLPMTNSPVATMVRSSGEYIHFQEYWVRCRGSIPVDAVKRVPELPPPATEDAIKAITEADAVIIGPSNPVTSILPILECQGVREALREQYVIAISPFIGEAPFSGPAGELMKAKGFSPSSLGTWELYRDFLDLFVQDERDTVNVPGATRLDTMMTGEEKSRELAEGIFGLIEEHNG